jgi:hypothetical protein
MSYLQEKETTMHHHMSLATRLRELRERGEPVFERTNDLTLASFAQLFLDSELFAFDANKRLRPDSLSPRYDCETESRAQADDEPEKFVVTWTPVWPNSDPVTGFRVGWDSAAFGSTPTIAMPQDERTAALLLLVTTPYIHLSAIRSDSGSLIQGAIETEDNTFRYLTLDPDAVGADLMTSVLAAGTPRHRGGLTHYICNHALKDRA